MAESRLRKMRENDLDVVLSWRNHPDVRHFMYTTHEITLDEHRRWFFQNDRSQSSDLLIYEQRGQPCGFANITRTRCEAIADWGFYMAPGAMRGSGRGLGQSVLDYAFKVLGLHKVCGQALGFNERSIRFHLSLGFREEGRMIDQHFDGRSYQDVVCFGVLESEWPSSN